MWPVHGPVYSAARAAACHPVRQAGSPSPASSPRQPWWVRPPVSGRSASCRICWPSSSSSPNASSGSPPKAAPTERSPTLLRPVPDGVLHPLPRGGRPGAPRSVRGRRGQRHRHPAAADDADADADADASEHTTGLRGAGPGPGRGRHGGQRRGRHRHHPRQNNFTLGGVPTQSDTGLASTVAFEPLAGGQTAVAPDFALTAAEVQPVMQTMRGQGFTIHCLYNQKPPRTRSCTSPTSSRPVTPCSWRSRSARAWIRPTP